MSHSETPLQFLSAAELQRKLATGETTSVALVSQFLDHIERHNWQGRKLNAVTATLPRELAVTQAKELDEERVNGKLRGPLHGIPIIVKDTVVTDEAWGMPTSAGTAVFTTLRARENATVVDRMRENGLIILGKGNMTEFCGMKNKDTPVGWSAFKGQTLSAYRRKDLDEKDQPVSGGSSSGSAVSVSAGFAPLAIGTETTGSMVLPASTNGVYAIKLSYGAVPTRGIFKLSRSYDCVGAMARDPADLAPLASILISDHSNDVSQAVQTRLKQEELRKGARDETEKGFKGLGIAVMAPAWGVHESVLKGKWDHPDVISKYEGAIEKMRSLGARTVYPLQVPEADDVLKYKDQSLATTAYYEFPHNVEEFIACFHDNPEIRKLQDIVDWNEANKHIAMPEPHTGQSELIAALNSTLSPDDHAATVAHLRHVAERETMGKAMNDANVDIVLSASDAQLVTFAACAGWPTAAVPLGRWTARNGQPYGMFALARRGREDVLLRFMVAWKRHDIGDVERPNMEGWE
ncbi:Amidase [Purpureocillium takamizusanense]|uniref:Amidase n=1 Tax=Purpureocillium takamizusanense TaxID=2060973 RepID=A0A9Q8QBU5_9HYPO|nr:Amidase [Purpureocillium takamizusanense]UNI16392.1 Amidase [Purpureocillium takamizusanense]